MAGIANDNGTLTDETVNSNTGGVSDRMNLLPAVPVINQDSFYIGHPDQFTQMRIEMAQVGTGGFTITWEYWNGTSWASLSGVVDDTNSFSVSGDNVISWTLPGDWDTNTFNSQGPYYYIRGRLTAGTVTQVPLGEIVTLDVTRYETFEDLFTITSSGLSIKVTWNIDNISKFRGRN